MWGKLFTLIYSLPCGQKVKKSVLEHDGAYGQSPFFLSFDHEVGLYLVLGTNGQMSIHIKTDY